MPEQRWTFRVLFQAECDAESIRDVLEFFLKNPKAVDTVEGITRWRLLEVTVHHALNNTRKAVGFLVKKGYLKPLKVTGSEDLFSFNETQLVSAERLLRDLAGSDREEQGS